MQAQRRPSWWGRNWKWVVLAGCLAVVLVCGACGGIITLVFGVIKSSDVYVDSLAAARSSPEVQTALGTPIEPGFLVTGSIEVSGFGGHADIAYGISGPKGSATVYAIGDKSAGQWTFNTLAAKIEATGNRIDLSVPAGFAHDTTPATDKAATIADSWDRDEMREAAFGYERAKGETIPDGDLRILKWRVIRDERPLVVEEAIVLLKIGDNRWRLASLYRNPEVRKPPVQWRLTGKTDVPFVSDRDFDTEPGYDQINRFLVDVEWQAVPTDFRVVASDGT